jgi:hypothetical protein
VFADGPPIEPSRQEAQRWAVEELSKRPYQEQRPGLVARLMTWVQDRFADLSLPAGTGSALLYTVLVCVLAVLVVLAVRRFGVRGRRARAERLPVLADVTASARELRELAAAHAAAGDWPQAVAARFRAIARELESATEIRVLPGLTATELADAGAAALPRLAGELRAAARIFDEAVYGHHPVTEQDYQRLVALDGALSGAKPVSP